MAFSATCLRALGGAGDDVGGHALGQRPAHGHAGVQVDRRRQVEPALAGAQVGDVPKSLRVGTGLAKSRLIRSGFGLASPSGTVVLFDLYGVQPRIPGPAHALAHAVQRNAAQAVGREAPHEPRAETPVGLEPHAPHGVECLGPVVDEAAVGNPAVAARPTHPQHFGHHRHPTPPARVSEITIQVS